MKAHPIEAQVYQWFEKRYPAGPQWRSATFTCFRDAPAELRRIVIMDKVEAEIANGGPAQLLWNVFYHWRRLLEDAEAGYQMIGATAQRDAIQSLRDLLAHYEPECRTHIERCIRDQDISQFNKWYEFGEGVMGSPHQQLFYDTSGVHEMRLEWLNRNEARLATLMTA